MTDDAEPDLADLCSFRLDSAPGPVGSVTVLELTGEIDLLTVGVLRTALVAALDPAPHDVVLDLTGVRFCSVSGVRMMGEAARTMQIDGIGFALCGLSTHLARVITLVCPDEVFVRYRCSTVAVAAAVVDQTYRD